MRALPLAALALAGCHAQLDARDGMAPDDLAIFDASPPPDLAPPPQCNVIFDNMNIGGVAGGATSPTFDLADGYVLCELFTYHWNNETGMPAGTIGLKNVTTGATYGPYPAMGSSGQGGKPNTNWDVQLDPPVPLAAGEYQVIDSDPASWSWDDPGMHGFSRITVALIR